MRTGCLTLRPRTKADYNKKRRTVIVELARVNVLKWNYPLRGADNMLPTLENTLLELKDDCEWYNAADPTQTKAPIPFPAHSTRRVGNRLYRNGVVVTGADLATLFGTQGPAVQLTEDEAIEELIRERDNAGEDRVDPSQDLSADNDARVVFSAAAAAGPSAAGPSNA